MRCSPSRCAQSAPGEEDRDVQRGERGDALRARRPAGRAGTRAAARIRISCRRVAPVPWMRRRTSRAARRSGPATAAGSSSRRPAPSSATARWRRRARPAGSARTPARTPACAGMKAKNSMYIDENACAASTPVPKIECISAAGSCPANIARSTVASCVVEQVAGPQQRHDALEVAVREVGRVEAQQRGADGDAAAQRPALTPHRRGVPQRRVPAWRERRAARITMSSTISRPTIQDTPSSRLAGDVVGVADRDAGRVGGDQRREEGEGGDDRPGGHGAPHGRARTRPGGRAGCARAGRAVERSVTQFLCVEEHQEKDERPGDLGGTRPVKNVLSRRADSLLLQAITAC